MKEIPGKSLNLFFILIMLLLQLYSSCSRGMEIVQTVPIKELNNPYEIYANRGRLYITDSADEEQRCTSVLVYSLKDYGLLFKMGGDGEGPGKYTMQKGHSIYVGFPPDKLFINDYEKIGLYTADGEFITERKTLGNSTIYQALNDIYVGREDISEDGVSFYAVYLYNSELERMKEIYRIENPYNTKTKKNRVFTRELRYRSYQDHVYLIGSSEDFVIDVFDSSGTRLNTIQLPYRRDEVTDYHKEEVYQTYRNHPLWGKYYDLVKNEIVFPQYLPAIFDFRVADDKIYVTTYRRKKGMTEFYILNMNGKFLKRMYVPFNWQYPRYAVLDGKIFQLMKNADTNQWKLKITQLI